EPASDAAAADSPPGPTGTEQKSAGSRPFRGAALVAAGLLVGLVVGLALAPVLRPASSLEVFDTTEPPETLPAVAEMLHQIWDSREDAPYRTLLYDVRALGVIEGKEIYGGLAARVYPDGSGAREVCLLMQRVGTDPGGTATCVLREDLMK